MSVPSPKQGMVVPGDDGTVSLVYHRDFEAKAIDVWEWLTSFDKLAQWIGRCEGKPEPGATLTFVPNTEGVEEGVAPGVEALKIDTCRAPNELAIAWLIPGRPLWEVRASVADIQHGCILRVSHDVVDPTRSELIGTLWHFLLDRLEAARDEKPAPTWDGYPQALSERYSAPPPTPSKAAKADKPQQKPSQDA